MAQGQEALLKLPVLEKELGKVQEENEKLATHLRELKQEKKDIKRTAQAAEDQVRSLYNRSQRQLHELQENTERERREATRSLEEHSAAHTDQIGELVTHNTALLQKHLKLVSDVPESLRVSSQAIQSATRAAEDVRRAERKAFDAQVSKLRDAAATESENFKMQYDYLIDLKEKETQSFVQQFNKCVQPLKHPLDHPLDHPLVQLTDTTVVVKV